MSLRQAILDQSDLPREPVTIPEWTIDGAPVRLWVRTMTGDERDAYEMWCVRQKDGDLVGIRAKLVCLCTVDEDGARVFQDKDAAALGKKSVAALQRLFNAARKLNALSSADVEELEKNSAGALNGDSGSDSVSSLESQLLSAPSN